MKKLLSIALLLFFLVACSCAPGGKILNPGFGGTLGDPQAAQVQEYMASAVYIDVTMQVVFPSDQKCDEKLKVCTPPIPKEVGGAGSGVVVDVKGKKSLILTAAHVCKTDVMERPTDPLGLLPPEKGLVTKEVVTVTNPWGGEGAARVLSVDEKNDACVLEVDGVMGPPVVLAPMDPPIGATVVNTGYPEGVQWDVGLWYHTGQVYAKENIESMPGHFELLTNIPIIGGLSGSPVFYHGRLAGIMRAVRVNFHHASFMVPVSELRKLVEEAKTK